MCNQGCLLHSHYFLWTKESFLQLQGFNFLCLFLCWQGLDYVFVLPGTWLCFCVGRDLTMLLFWQGLDYVLVLVLAGTWLCLVLAGTWLCFCGKHYIIYISFRQTVHFHTLLFYCRQKMANITSFTSASEKQYISTLWYFIVDKRWQTLHHLHQLQTNSIFPHFVILL